MRSQRRAASSSRLSHPNSMGRSGDAYSPRSPVSPFTPLSSRHTHSTRPQHIPWAGEDPTAEQSSIRPDRETAMFPDPHRASSRPTTQALQAQLDLLGQKMSHVPELQEGFWELQNVAQVIRNKEAWMATQLQRIEKIRLVLEEHYVSKRKAKQPPVEAEEGQIVADE